MIYFIFHSLWSLKLYFNWILKVYAIISEGALAVYDWYGLFLHFGHFSV